MSNLPIVPTRSLPAKVVMCVILWSPWTSPRSIWQPHLVRRGTKHFKELINECVKSMAQFEKESIQPLERKIELILKDVTRMGGKMIDTVRLAKCVLCPYTETPESLKYT